MKQKQIVILLLILCALILGILFKKMIQTRNDAVVSGDQLSNEMVLNFEPGKVSRILMGRGEKTPSVEIVKQKDGWRIKSLWNAMADEEKMGGLFKKLRAIRGEFRSSGKDLFADFGVSDETAVFIKLVDAQDAALLDIRLGAPREGSAGCFLRKAGTDEVYSTDVGFADLLGIYMPLAEAEISGNYWADLKPFRIDPERILSIVAKYSGENGGEKAALGIERGGSGKPAAKSPWVFVKSKNSEDVIDPEKILRFIVALNNVQAQAVVDPNGKGYGLDQPAMVFTLREEGRNEVLVSVSPKSSSEDAFFLKSGDRSEIFKVPGHFFQDLEMKDEKFLKDTPEAAEAPKVP